MKFNPVTVTHKFTARKMHLVMEVVGLELSNAGEITASPEHFVDFQALQNNDVSIIGGPGWSITVTKEHGK